MQAGVQNQDFVSLDRAVALMVEALEVLDRTPYRGAAAARLQHAVDTLLIDTGRPLEMGISSDFCGSMN